VGARVLAALQRPPGRLSADAAHAQRGDAPVLLRVETSAGHSSAGKPTAKAIAEAADRLAFLWLWMTTLQFAPFNLITWGPYLLLGPVLARAYLGGARAWGLVMAAGGAGAVLSSLVVLSLPCIRAITWSGDGGAGASMYQKASYRPVGTSTSQGLAEPAAEPVA
jgi:hypothetical protein